MAVAAGAMQVAAIKKQQASQAQGYGEGGFTRKGRADEVAGVVHAGEWVASQKLVASPVARPLIEALDYAQRTNTMRLCHNCNVATYIGLRPRNLNKLFNKLNKNFIIILIQNLS